MATRTKEQKQAEYDRLVEEYHRLIGELEFDLKRLGEYEYRVNALRQKMKYVVESLAQL